LFLFGDIDETDRRLLIESQHGLVYEHHRRTTARTCPDGIAFAQGVIEGSRLPKRIVATLDFDLTVDRYQTAHDGSAFGSADGPCRHLRHKRQKQRNPNPISG
jgi:hypothetical protein